MTRFSESKGILDLRRGPSAPGSGCTIIKLCFCPGEIIRVTGRVGPSSHKRLRVADMGRRFLFSRSLGIRMLKHNFT